MALPARFHDAGHEAGRGELTKGNSRHLELPVVPARAAADSAAIPQPGWRTVARELGKLKARLETLLDRTFPVLRDRPERFRRLAYFAASRARFRWI